MLKMSKSSSELMLRKTMVKSKNLSPLMRGFYLKRMTGFGNAADFGLIKVRSVAVAPFE